ncbi:2-methylaconitate cis-trans isomerase PrpF family protein [Paraburkholderia strydomiana]|uniref:2-methylaconitate cis-trans isomerase PrpF family protein n=1 Tax=Paraburkholderia strydomiana TaxID=1245417 RepID=UPI001BECAE5A|nr:2-methylaconitate cis-trans isomerase PrpF family protein [Paraburkholderia strydomiana]MBT2793570.1 PrpF family protein [Paraburkholderia strydomiana]
MKNRYRAAFIRGGTSKALVFQSKDLPLDRAAWDDIFLQAMGTPDSYGRQLNGMGGGVSSLSKVCVVGPPSVPDADVDYTFAQVQIHEAVVDYKGNCGNMSAAIGPFAVDENIVDAPRDGQVCVRIHNTNTGKIIHSTFPVANGRSVETGDLSIPGVSGTGAPIRLDFVSPGGASTGALLPTGNVIDSVFLPGEGEFNVSMIDAANACVFVEASAVGLSGTESAEELATRHEVMALLGELRRHASVAMGIASDLKAADLIRTIPFIGVVAAPTATIASDGSRIIASDADLVVRMLSSGQPHKALPLTASLCTAVAMQIGGSIPNRLADPGRNASALRLAMPSGVLAVAAEVSCGEGGWRAESGSFYRTSRRLFDGYVYA